MRLWGDWHEFQLQAADDLSAGLLSKWALVQQYGDRYGASGLHAADIINAAIGGKLALRFNASRVIPLGLFCIGLGFALMALGHQHISSVCCLERCSQGSLWIDQLRLSLTLPRDPSSLTALEWHPGLISARASSRFPSILPSWGVYWFPV